MSRLKTILLLIFLPLANVLLADSPPCWCKFERFSDNKKFVAVVDKIEEDSLKEPWMARWTLKVYELKDNSRILLWESPYESSGYRGGKLSDNGKYFVYVEFWYYEEIPLMKIYNSGNKINTSTLIGKEFGIPNRKLEQTVSHKLWLSEEQCCSFVLNNNQIKYLIKTIDGKEHYIDLEKGTFIK